MEAQVIGSIVGIGSVIGGLVLYVVRSELRGEVTRLDGRINTHEKGCEQRQQKLDERHTAITSILEELHEGQKEANRKLDSLVGFRP